jgi:N-acetylglucosamine-6-phosphate deacetylase
LRPFAGARLSTHLGNAYPAQCHPRDNAVWWQLACDRLSASFITDGHHLPVPFIITALRAKGVDRFIVVSDAAPITGLPPGDYETMGVPARLEPSGRVSLRGSRDTLAGSGSTMRACMAHLASLGLLTPAELRRVSVENPLQLLGLAPAAVGAPPVC